MYSRSTERINPTGLIKYSTSIVSIILYISHAHYIYSILWTLTLSTSHKLYNTSIVSINPMCLTPVGLFSTYRLQTTFKSTIQKSSHTVFVSSKLPPSQYCTVECSTQYSKTLAKNCEKNHNKVNKVKYTTHYYHHKVILSSRIKFFNKLIS